MLGAVGDLGHAAAKVMQKLEQAGAGDSPSASAAPGTVGAPFQEARMDLSQIGLGERIAAGGALALLISLFLPWYGVEVSGFSADASGWEAMSLVDILLFLGSLVVLGIIGAKAAGALPTLPLPPTQILLSIGGTATLLVLLRLIDIPEPDGSGDSGVDFDRKFGVFFALISAGAIAYGAFRSQSD